MNKSNNITELLKGVEVDWKALSSVAQYVRGLTYNKKNESNNSIGYKVLRANNITLSNNTLNFNDVKIINLDTKVKDTQKLYKNDILISAASGSREHVGKVAFITNDIDYYFGGFMGVIRSSNKISPRYLFHILTSEIFQNYLNEMLNSSTINNLSSKIIEGFQIPIPPLHIQTEIVRILDTFTALTAELTTRQKQYNYYRNKLLTFKEDEVEWKLISEFASLKRGIRVTRNQLSQKNGYHVYQNSLTPLGYYEKANTQENTTFIISAGAAGEIGYSSEKFWAADDCFYFECSKNLLNRYLFYVLKNKQEYISSQVRRSSIPRLPRAIIEKLKIPIPPLKEQARIVEILDKFDALTNSITEGLPHEIALRQKQYEYYRNLLLNFPKMEDK
jgi:type I restriction enzyme, S subunit